MTKVTFFIINFLYSCVCMSSSTIFFNFLQSLTHMSCSNFLYSCTSMTSSSIFFVAARACLFPLFFIFYNYMHRSSSSVFSFLYSNTHMFFFSFFLQSWPSTSAGSFMSLKVNSIWGSYSSLKVNRRWGSYLSQNVNLGWDSCLSRKGFVKA